MSLHSLLEYGQYQKRWITVSAGKLTCSLVSGYLDMIMYKSFSDWLLKMCCTIPWKQTVWSTQSGKMKGRQTEYYWNVFCFISYKLQVESICFFYILHLHFLLTKKKIHTHSSYFPQYICKDSVLSCPGTAVPVVCYTVIE